MSASAYPIRVGEEEIGQVAVFSPLGKGAPWSYLGVENARLAIDSLQLAKGELRHWETGEVFEFPCIDKTATLDRLFSVGPTHDLIGHLPGRDPRGAFEFHSLKEREGARDEALWKADCQTQRRLLVSPTHKGFPVRQKLAQQMRLRKSRLLYQRGIQWTSQRLLAATTMEPVLGGSAWTTWRGEEKLQKAFALWANSIIGFLVYWTQGQRTQKGRSRTQIGALKKILCPNLPVQRKSKLEEAAAFDELAKLELRPACQAHCDPARKRIDDAVCQMLSIPPRFKKTIDKLRRLWCEEPSVHGNHKTALKLLKNPSD